MATSVDMSLDDIIKSRKNTERTRGRGRGGRRGRGQGRTFGGGRMNGVGQRGPLAVNARPSSYTIGKSIRRKRSFPWQTELFEDSIRAVGIQGIEVGTKLYVSNLQHGVTNEDIRVYSLSHVILTFVSPSDVLNFVLHPMSYSLKLGM